LLVSRITVKVKNLLFKKKEKDLYSYCSQSTGKNMNIVSLL
jgi:hypothetical protein